MEAETSESFFMSARVTKITTVNDFPSHSAIYSNLNQVITFVSSNLVRKNAAQTFHLA